MLDCLPTYARDGVKVGQTEFQHWKKYYIRANREFYNKHKEWLENWIPKILEFENSHQKFEWNCGDMGVSLSGRALRFNLFVRSSQKGFSLQSLTQNKKLSNHKFAA